MKGVRYMEVEERKMDSKHLLKKLQAEYYKELETAHENGRKVCWASSIIPQEFLEAMDIAVCYPENHSAAIAARKGAMPFLKHAEAMGYSNDICSYARINLAYADLLESDIQNIPKPDFVVCINNICGVLVKWYENLAKHFNVPYILIDVPYNYNYNPDGDMHARGAVDVTDERVAYIKEQFKDFIHKLEEICGRPFDYEKFDRVMEISNRTAQAWLKAMSYCAQKPSPMDGFNMFNYMSLMVCLRGRETTAQLYEMIAVEMEENIREGKSQFPGEQKYRVMWDGIACWPYLSHNYKTLLKNGMVLAGSTYPRAWAMTYGQNSMDDLARIYAGLGNNCSVQRQAEGRASIQEECQVDGIIYHINRSCKIMDFTQPEMRRKAYEINHIPYISFDGDQSDPQNFSEAQFETRIQGLVENMEARRQEKEAARA